MNVFQVNHPVDRMNFAEAKNVNYAHENTSAHMNSESVATTIESGSKMFHSGKKNCTSCY